jgi:hypothetical protein
MGDIYPDGGPQDTGQQNTAPPDPLRAEADAAREKLSGAVDTVKGEAVHLADTAKQKAAEKADQGKEAITSALGDFSEAIRRAGEELGEKDQTLAARLVAQAADGLETLSRAVSEKRPEDMLNAVRDFGRNNPTAFLAGSVLAGLALGRFARSSAQHAEADSQTAYGQTYGSESRFGEGASFVEPEPASFQAEGDTLPPDPMGMTINEDEPRRDEFGAPQTGL